MITRRPASERGRTRIGWLDSRHSFSFGGYYDPRRLGFRALRVLNDDRVAPGAGFGRHAHRDMEIVSLVLEGELAHADSLGTGSIILPGEIQRMSAGTGVVHSELNPSPILPVHFLQIWIVPERPGLPPGYEQRAIPPRGDEPFRAIGGRDGRGVTIHADVTLALGSLAAGERARWPLGPGRAAYLHVIRGEILAGSATLAEGDGAEIESEPVVLLEARTPAEVLLFDLA